MMTETEYIVMGGIADNWQNKIDCPDVGGDGRIGQQFTAHVCKIR